MREPTISGTGRERLSLHLSTKAKRKLIALRVRTGATSLAEVVRRALALYESAQGGTVVLGDGTEVQVP